MVEGSGFPQMGTCRGQGYNCHRAIIEGSGEHMTFNRGCCISPLRNPMILFLFIPWWWLRKSLNTTLPPQPTSRLDIGIGPAEAQGNGKLPRLSSGRPLLECALSPCQQGDSLILFQPLPLLCSIFIFSWHKPYKVSTLGNCKVNHLYIPGLVTL